PRVRPGVWNRWRRWLHCLRPTSPSDPSAPGVHVQLRISRADCSLVLGGRRRTAHSGRNGPAAVGRGVPASVRGPDDGDAIRPGHAARAAGGERRVHPPHEQSLRPSPPAPPPPPRRGSKELQPTMLIALVLGLSVLALVVAWSLRG